MSARFSKRYDSSSKNSLDADVTNDSTEHRSEDENLLLKKRISQLELENEKLKASLFVLSQKLSKKGETISIESLLNAAIPPLPLVVVPNNTNVLPKDPIFFNEPRRTSADIFSSKDQSGAQELVDDGSFVYRATLIGHESDVYSCKYSPDGNYICSTSLDNTVRIWNQSNGVQTILGSHSFAGTDLSWLDSSHVVSSSFDMSLKIWDVTQGTSTCVLRTNGVALSTCYVNSNLVIAGTSTGEVELFDIRSGRLVSMNRCQGAVNCVSFEKGIILSGDSKGKLTAWDMNIANPFILFEVESNKPITSITTHAGHYLALNCYDDTIRLLSKKKDELKLIQTIRGLRNRNLPIRSSFSKSISKQVMLASGNGNDSSLIFGFPSITTAEESDELLSPFPKLLGHSGVVYCCDFNNENHLVTCSSDRTLKLWVKKF